MKHGVLALLFLVAGAVSAAGTAQSPIGKVLQLISDLQTKIVKEGDEAQKTYSEFTEWCEERSRNAGFEIKTGKTEVADLKASIESATANAGALAAKIEELTASIATDEADLKAATEIRSKEAADFVASEKELMETISTLERAIGILEREMKKGGASLAQLKRAGGLAEALGVMVEASMLGSQDAARLSSLVQSAQGEDSDADLGAPAATVYKGQSGGIIETLEGLLDKAKEQIDSSRSKETSSKHNFEMLQQSLKDEIKFAEKDFAAAKRALAMSSEAKAAAQGDLASTDAALKEDVTTLASLHQTCMTKAQDFEAATKSRGEELQALAEAKKAIAESTSGADTVAYGLNQVSLLQVAEAQGLGAAGLLRSGADLANFEAVRLVRDLARRQHSEALAQLARRMASAMRAGSGAGDPFAKVKGLIKDMIERLAKEAHADASHKAYCDKETSETATKKAEKDAEIDKLTARIDAMAARSAQLKEEVAALQGALADLAAAQAEAGKIRKEEHSSFVANKADTEQGIEGVKLALKILREYFSKEDKAHEAAEGAAAGIIGMLEVVESDFTKALAEMNIAEQTAQADYDKDTKETAISKATKDQDVKYKTKEYKDLDRAAAEASSDREGVRAELDAVMDYSGKLTEMCVAKPETYETRKARREAELAGLKQALEILKGEAVLLQQGVQLRGIRRVRA
mmetsp:Transcript_12946/g.27102  ORF Transcript_12946/g.27102 Transcript_12946/m.27102 type:complete len:693 (+) Transcript_12946:77-2155(+)